MKKNDDTIQEEELKKPDEQSGEELSEEVASEEEQVEKTQQEDNRDKKEEQKEWEDKYKRALADYQNLEKRVAQQRRDLILSAGRGILERLLPVLDTLQLAAKHTDDQGLKVSIQQFLDVLKGEGVEKIETENKSFDPATMEAVGTGKGEDGKVVEEARAGYMLHDSLLRAAQVIVGQKDKS